MSHKPTPLSAYIHIPFCKQKCNYCDFLSFPNRESLFLSYKNALLKEIENCPELENSCIETVFFGGGTPTLLPAEFLCEILEAVQKRNVRSDAEITVECNPEAITHGYLSALKAAGVNRLSIGLQSSHNRLLAKLGRIHTVEKFEGVYNEAVRCGFSNINFDIMFALPGQRVEDFRQTLDYIVSLNPAHISAYGLIIEEGTPFFEAAKSAELALPDEELDREMYYLANNVLNCSGYKRYEISNFAKAGFESEHNKAYWTYKDYIGIGLGAHSFVSGKRFNNLTELDKYIEAKGDIQLIRQGFLDIGLTEAMSEFMFLGLRMSEGVCCEAFKKKFGVNIFDVFGDEIRNFEKICLIKCNKSRIFLTEKGVDLSNVVFTAFIRI